MVVSCPIEPAIRTIGRKGLLEVKTIIACGLFLFAANAGQAATWTLADVIKEFNGVTRGDWHSSSNTGGRGYVGGDLFGQTDFGNNGSYQGAARPTLESGSYALVVKGDLHGGANVNGPEDVLVGGNVTSGLNKNGGGHAHVGGTVAQPRSNITSGLSGDADFEARFPDLDFDALTKEFDTLAGLDGMTATVSHSYAVNGNRYSFDKGSNHGAAAVYNLHLSDLLNTGNEFDNIDFAGATTVVVNVAGTMADLGASSASINMNAMDQNNFGNASRIVWNFLFDGDLTISGNQFVGSILAPYANLGIRTRIEGSVLAGSIFEQSAQIHLQGFDGTIPVTTRTEIPPVPLPAGIFLLAGAVGTLGAWRLRRKNHTI